MKGMLIASLGSFFFRVYNEDQGYTDYQIFHDDLNIEIEVDPAFVKVVNNGDGTGYIDHSDSVMGYSNE